MKNCRPEIVVCFGSPIEEILNAAQERDTGLIVMGARRSSKRATFSRSVSYRVTSRATCPVLTVRGTRQVFEWSTRMLLHQNILILKAIHLGVA